MNLSGKVSFPYLLRMCDLFILNNVFGFCYIRNTDHLAFGSNPVFHTQSVNESDLKNSLVILDCSHFSVLAKVYSKWLFGFKPEAKMLFPSHAFFIHKIFQRDTVSLPCQAVSMTSSDIK